MLYVFDESVLQLPKKAMSSIGSFISKSITSKVKDKIKSEAEQFITEKSEKIGNKAQKLFHDLVYKEDNLIGKVDSTGEKVTIYKTNPDVIRNLMSKSGFDTKQMPLISSIPEFFVKPIFQKADALLVDKIGKYISYISSNLLAQGAIYSMSKTVGASQEFLERKLSELNSSSDISKEDVQKFLGNENENLSSEEISDLTKMVNHYFAKIKIKLHRIIEDVVAKIAGVMIEELVENITDKAENKIEAAAGIAAVAGATLLNPNLGIAAGVAIGTDAKTSTSTNKSYLHQLSESVKSFFWNKESTDNIKLSAENNAKAFVQNNGFINERTFEDAYGKYDSSNSRHASYSYDSDYLDVSDDGDGNYSAHSFIETSMTSFIEVEKTEEPMNLSEFLRRETKGKFNTFINFFSGNKTAEVTIVNTEDTVYETSSLLDDGYDTCEEDMSIIGQSDR